MRIKIALNATPLLAPLTGIGYYIASLLEQLHGFEELETYPFYGATWLRPPGKVMRLSMAAIHRLLRVLPQGPITAVRSAQQQAFDWGTSRYGFTLYHEPNYCPLEFHGPTVVTVCDLSFIRFPETMPLERLRHLE